MFLGAWVVGTFIFAVAFNWTVNVRSVLPLVPAASILLARRASEATSCRSRLFKTALGLGLAISAFLALWVTKADAEWADTQRRAARIIYEQGQSEGINVWFQGHWGFRYYMQALGMRPVDLDRGTMQAGDLLAIPANNIETFPLRTEYIDSQERLEVPYGAHVTTMRLAKASGFYAAVYGPLPFVFGQSRPERYFIFRLRMTAGKEAWER